MSQIQATYNLNAERVVLEPNGADARAVVDALRKNMREQLIIRVPSIAQVLEDAMANDPQVKETMSKMNDDEGLALKRWLAHVNGAWCGAKSLNLNELVGTPAELFLTNGSPIKSVSVNIETADDAAPNSAPDSTQPQARHATPETTTQNTTTQPAQPAEEPATTE